MTGHSSNRGRFVRAYRALPNAPAAFLCTSGSPASMSAPRKQCIHRKLFVNHDLAVIRHGLREVGALAEGRATVERCRAWEHAACVAQGAAGRGEGNTPWPQHPLRATWKSGRVGQTPS